MDSRKLDEIASNVKLNESVLGRMEYALSKFNGAKEHKLKYPASLQENACKYKDELEGKIFNACVNNVFNSSSIFVMLYFYKEVVRNSDDNDVFNVLFLFFGLGSVYMQLSHAKTVFENMPEYLRMIKKPYTQKLTPHEKRLAKYVWGE